MDLSIVIVNWNAKQHLLDCLNSIYTSCSCTFEVIVVDNASVDGSREAVKEAFPQVRLTENSENLGFAKANNIGLSLSTGRYVALVNSDVIVLRSCFQNLIRFLDQHPKVGMASPRLLNPDRTLQFNCRSFPGIWNNLCQTLGLNYVFPRSAFFSEPFMKYWDHKTVRDVDVLTGSFWIVRREAIGQVGPLDEDFFFYGEDVDWCKRFCDAGWSVTFCPDAEAIHIGGASSGNAPIRFYIELQKADLRYWEKHRGKIGRLSYASIVLLRQALRLLYATTVYLLRSRRRSDAAFKIRRSLACMRYVLLGTEAT